MNRDLNRKQYKKVRYLLASIYGRETADTEVDKWFRTTFSIGEVVEQIERSLYKDEEIFFRDVCEKWAEIAGKVFGEISHPVSVNGNILFVEIKHTTYMSSISSHAKKKLLEKIRKRYGKDICSEIRFLPPGRSR